jgi:hypothetical protein
MITVPTTILDNFLDNPKDIRNFGLKLKYTQAELGNYPGKRTECLSQIHPEYYNYINTTILSLFFPSEPIPTWDAITQFHLTKNLEKTGWIHQDPNIQITALIYLSNDDPSVNRGTSFFELKSGLISPFNNKGERSLYNYMPKHYLTGKIDQEVYEIKTKWEEKTFNKTLNIKDKFNRIIIFDPSTFHANNIANTPELNERLTLISFIYGISSPFNFPIPRSKQMYQI